MKKLIIEFLTINIFICCKVAREYIQLTTSKNVGEKITLRIYPKTKESEDNIWIDINNNNKKEQGETVTEFKKEMSTFKLKNKTFRIYGNV